MKSWTPTPGHCLGSALITSTKDRFKMDILTDITYFSLALSPLEWLHITSLHYAAHRNRAPVHVRSRHSRKTRTSLNRLRPSLHHSLTKGRRSASALWNPKHVLFSNSGRQSSEVIREFDRFKAASWAQRLRFKRRNAGRQTNSKQFPLLFQIWCWRRADPRCITVKLESHFSMAQANAALH